MKSARIALVAAATTLALAPSIASANWDYSRWGMTPAQVIAASKGAAKPQPLDYGDSIGANQFLASADHQMGPHAFKTEFYFENGAALALIRLTLKDSAGCDRLEGDLVKRYGPRSPSGRYFWIDKTSGDVITFSDDRGSRMSCRLVYKRP